MGHDCARTRYRAAVAVEMRMAGAEYQEIAKELGYADKSGAWRAVMRAMNDRQVKAVDRLRMVEFADLNEQHRAVWQQAKAGDFKAIDQVLRCADARLKLLGLM